MHGRARRASSSISRSTRWDRNTFANRDHADIVQAILNTRFTSAVPAFGGKLLPARHGQLMRARTPGASRAVHSAFSPPSSTRGRPSEILNHGQDGLIAMRPWLARENLQSYQDQICEFVVRSVTHEESCRRASGGVRQSDAKNSYPRGGRVAGYRSDRQ